jgi:hypothetical protein
LIILSKHHIFRLHSPTLAIPFTLDIPPAIANVVIDELYQMADRARG